MTRFVVLLRGVNVGGHNRVPMAELRGLLQAQGCADVQTLLNSGNAVFGSPRRSAAGHARAIAAALHDRLGLTLDVVVKSLSEFDAAVSENPLAPPDEEHSRLLVAFAQDSGALQGLSVLLPLVRPPERLAFGSQAVYLHCAGGILQSKAGAALLGKAGRGVTTRNWATVLKLAALARGAFQG